MKTRFSKIGKYLAASLFFLALMVNLKFSLTDPFVTVGDELIAQTTGEETTTGGSWWNPIDWWNSKTDDYQPNCPCNVTIEFFKVNGQWTNTSGGFGVESTMIPVAGTQTECVPGNRVAHCWDCTGRDCVASNDDIVRILNELNIPE